VKWEVGSRKTEDRRLKWGDGRPRTEVGSGKNEWTGGTKETTFFQYKPEKKSLCRKALTCELSLFFNSLFRRRNFLRKSHVQIIELMDGWMV
jgi:hypothetical protein